MLKRAVPVRGVRGDLVVQIMSPLFVLGKHVHRSAAAFVTWCVLAAFLVSAPAYAQVLPDSLTLGPPEATWQPPDVAALPSDWWSQFETVSPQIASQRVERFLVALEQRIGGLSGDELVIAQNRIANLKSLFELLALARQGSLEPSFTPPLAKETYFLEDVLNLRAQWRELAISTGQVGLQVEQTNRQVTLLQERSDKLLREYNSAELESPTRILLGIGRVSTRLEYELALAGAENSRQTLKQIEAQSLLVNSQQAYAIEHLVSDDLTLAEIKSAVSDARAAVTLMTNRVAAVQPQLLDALSADTVNPSLEVLRKQQLTRASAEAELAQLREMLITAKSNWYHLRADELNADFDIQAANTQARRITDDALKQAELWSSISQSTLIAPVPDKTLNTVKNFEIAQSVARDTLEIVDKIRSTSDNLLLVHEILTAEALSAHSGLSNTGARLLLALSNAWDRVLDLADYHLFTIGDTPVTPGGVIKMLLILGLAISISWFIRRLLSRGIRKKPASQSPAFYTLGRILHYIIVVAGVFAALGSIGIDFTSFALIAGALSVGIGFGLQAIVSNFVSGLILLFEGTLRVGDYIELDSGLCGVVREINTRATIVNTNDSIDVVVPNTELVTTKLTNWTLRETVARIHVHFGVAYGSDKELVRKLALEAAQEVDFALTNMPGREPQVRLTNFGDNALEFDALIWVSRQGVRRPLRIKASFLWALETLFREHGIEIPFPQRDVHIKNDFRNPES